MEKSMLFFGGTFDPVHNGHMIVARHVAEQGGYDRVTLIPAATPPHKDPAEAPPEDRLAMLHAAVAGDPLFAVDEIELSRPGPSYTYDTLVALRRRLGDGVALHWMIGADMLTCLPSWHRVEEVLDLARLVVAVRPPWDARMDAIFADLEPDLGREAVARLRESVVQTPLIEISSSDIRGRVARGLSARYLVPEGVCSHIKLGGLYRRGEEKSWR